MQGKFSKVDAASKEVMPKLGGAAFLVPMKKLYVRMSTVHLARCLQFAMHKFRLSLFVKDLEPGGSATFCFSNCLKATCSVVRSFERVLCMWRCFKRLLICFSCVLCTVECYGICFGSRPIRLASVRKGCECLRAACAAFEVFRSVRKCE